MIRYVVAEFSELPGSFNVVDTLHNPAATVCQCDVQKYAQRIADLLNADDESKATKAANKKVQSIVVGLHG